MSGEITGPGERYVSAYMSSLAMNYAHKKAVRLLDDEVLEQAYWMVVGRGVAVGELVLRNLGRGVLPTEEVEAEVDGVGEVSKTIVDELKARDELLERSPPMWLNLLRQVMRRYSEMEDPGFYESTGLDLVGDPNKRIEYWR